MTDKPRLHVIQGTPAPDTPSEQVRKRVRAMDKPATMLQCDRCGGREVIEAKIGVMIKNGKPTGGTKALLCVGCLLNGERVVM
ncbi:hypothetical protein D3879_14680 [Pseudomonas cavernicola]|uniref:Uncharacterized protein n=1 Tax=Pseudomonas cavernicola TaxID=2320866 RepID=A0A418XEG9_9PSED|nr:hypothetical protein [Pseudomonas cavernicola]RJG10922.1 hypothetical protein D3879_14680 [Pseudomonas cavernicola]